MHQPNSTAAMFNRLDGALQAQVILGPLTALKVVVGLNPPANVINPGSAKGDRSHFQGSGAVFRGRPRGRRVDSRPRLWTIRSHHGSLP